MVSLIEGKVNPAYEGCLFIDASSLRIFGNLNRVEFIYVGQLFP